MRIANIRAAANQLGFSLQQSTIFAFLAFNSNFVVFNTSQFSVATPVPGLYDGFSTSLICTAHGSPLPDNLHSVKSFLASNAAFSSTRLTEGFASAFAQRSAPESLNADSGTRILVTYSGFPSGARLFVPDAVAGSDTVTPTSGGDLGIPASGGRYAPDAHGSLLLARVMNTDSNGAGGSVAFTPGSPGSGVVSFDAMNEVILSNGTGIAVYEVVDANPNAQESAQFPTFLGLAPFSGDPIVTLENVSLAPVSTVTIASTHDPIPRFQSMPPPADCSIIGDCNAFYYPKLFVNTTPLNFTAQSNGNFQSGFTQVNNHGGGHLVWVATISYTNGSGWLRIDPASGIDNATIRVDALPANLAPGTYQAILTVDGGPQAGSASVPITFVVTEAPVTPPPPTVAALVNAATFTAGPAVPGSIATLLGAQLSGKTVVVLFDSSQAQILYDGDKQINVVVPAALGNKSSAQLIVNVDGVQSVPLTVPVAQFSPVIFNGGVLNQDGKLNSPAQPAHLPNILQIFATGMSGPGAITARLNGAVVDPPVYGGPAPGLVGVQQVNVQLPAGLTGSTADIAVCQQAVCSPVVHVNIAQ